MDNEGPGQPEQPEQPEQPSSNDRPTEPVSQPYWQPQQPQPQSAQPEQPQQPEQPTYQYPQSPPPYGQPQQPQQPYQQPQQSYQQPQYQQQPPQPEQGGNPPQYPYQQQPQQYPPGYQPQYPYSQPPAPPVAGAPPKSSSRPIWLIVLIVVLALCLCGGIGTVGFFATTGRALNELASVSQTAIATVQVEDLFPTLTPVDSDLSTEPLATDTAEPEQAQDTDTPEASSSSDTATELEYLASWADWMSKYGDAFTKFALLSASPKLGDSSWQSDVSTQLDVISSVDTEVLDYTSTPDTFSKAHGDLQEAARHFDTMVSQYKEGIDKQDVGLLTQAAMELQTGSQEMENAVTELSKSAPGVVGLPTVGTEDTATPEVSEPEATSTSSSQSSSSGGDLSIGSTGETDGLNVTVNGVSRTTGGFFAPKDGNEYPILDLTFENTSSDEKSVSSLIEFSVKDDTGHDYSIAIVPEAKGSPDGSIAAGGKLTGESAFQVPKDATGLVFIFEPFLSGNLLRFKLDK